MKKVKFTVRELSLLIYVKEGEKAMKIWEKPQLIILARGNPEESVLVNCKTNNPTKPLDGADRQEQQQCSELVDTSCENCQDRGLGSDT